jgi:hypothetical protein
VEEMDEQGRQEEAGENSQENQAVSSSPHRSYDFRITLAKKSNEISWTGAENRLCIYS